jgi:hypothetical protein
LTLELSCHAGCPTDLYLYMYMLIYIYWNLIIYSLD